MKEISHSLPGAPKATSAPHPHLGGRGACVPLALPLTLVPASSTLIYGAIWCQVIAHQYPIYHRACHGLWLLFHKAKAFEKEPVTQDRKRT